MDSLTWPLFFGKIKKNKKILSFFVFFYHNTEEKRKLDFPGFYFFVLMGKKGIFLNE